MELSNEFEVERADRRGVGGAHRRRAHRPVPARRPARRRSRATSTAGMVKIKVGPITAQYKGKATFVEKDDAAHRAVLEAEGRDTRGQGNAAATITAQLDARRRRHERHRSTPTSRSPARSPSSAGACMADVSEKLLGQFVTCLEAKLGEQAASAGAGAAAADDAPASPEEDAATASPSGGPAPAAAPPRRAARRRRPPATVGPAPRRARTARARPPPRPVPAASTCPNPSPSTCSRPPEPRWRSGSRRSWWCCSSC